MEQVVLDLLKTNFFGLTLKEARKQRKMTQVQAAKNLSVTQAQWSAYEVGKTRPTIMTLVLVAKAIGIDPKELIARAFKKIGI